MGSLDSLPKLPKPTETPEPVQEKMVPAKDASLSPEGRRKQLETLLEEELKLLEMLQQLHKQEESKSVPAIAQHDLPACILSCT